jgi:hypothetical protein
LDEFKNPNSGIMSTMGIKDLKKKTQVFGNNPGVLRNADQEEIQLDGLIEALQSEEINKYIHNLSTPTMIGRTNINVAVHRMFFMEADTDYKTFKIVAASNYILCLIARYIDHIHLEDASAIYRSANNSVLQGIYFETYFHTYILKTKSQCEINITYKYQLNKDVMEFESHKKRKKYSFKVEKYNRTDTISFSDLINDEFFCPKIFNFSTFDSAFKGSVKENNNKINKEAIFFFQCTVGDKHEIKGKNYSIIKNCLNLKVKEVNLIFIVPNAEVQFNPYIAKGSNIDFDRNINVYLGSFPMLPN